ALLGLKKDEQAKWPATVTPAIIEREAADPQLAAALRTLVARLTGGDFIKTGRPLADLHDHAVRLEERRHRRDSLLQNLQELDRDIADLQKGAGNQQK